MQSPFAGGATERFGCRCVRGRYWKGTEALPEHGCRGGLDRKGDGTKHAIITMERMVGDVTTADPFGTNEMRHPLQNGLVEFIVSGRNLQWASHLLHERHNKRPWTSVQEARDGIEVGGGI